MRGRDGLFRREGDILAFRYKDKDVWKEKSTGTSNRQEARDFKKDFLHKLDKGELPTKKAKETVAAACAKWIEHHATVLKSPKARKNERSYLNQLTRRLGTRTLESITLDDLKEYQTERSKQVEARPINLELAILVRVMKEANLWYGPITHYRRKAEPESTVGRSLTPGQRHLLEVIAQSRDNWQVAYWAHLIAIHSGMRGGEIKRLQLKHLDLENRRITVEHAKTAAGNRPVALNATASWAVSKLYVRAQKLGACSPDHYLLPADLSRHTRKNDPLKGRKGFDVTRHQESWDTTWRNLRKEAVDSIVQTAAKQNRELTLVERADVAALGELGFHSMRHTFVTRSAEAGIPLAVTQAQVGHISAEMSRHYTHISEQAQREAVEKLDGFVGKFVGNEQHGKEELSKLLN